MILVVAIVKSPFFLKNGFRHDIVGIAKQTSYSVATGNVFYFGKNAFSVFAFPVSDRGLFGDK